MSPDELKAIKDANRPPHGAADRTVSTLVEEVERLTAERDAFRRHASDLNAQLAAAEATIDSSVTVPPGNPALRFRFVSDGRHAGHTSNGDCETCRSDDEGTTTIYRRTRGERDAAQRALEAAQADSARLRAALEELRPHARNWNGILGDRIADALATPADDSALREFGLRVASRSSDGQHGGETMAEIVDAVLRGER